MTSRRSSRRKMRICILASIFPVRPFSQSSESPCFWAHAARGRTSRAIASPLSIRAFVRSCMACRLTQNSGLVPKKRAKRKAVSADTPRSPLTMAPMRVAGTRKAIANALMDIPSGTRNSSLSTSPGWTVTRFGVATALVVVDDFDIGRSFFGPSETNAPLIIDPDRVLPPTVPSQCLQPVRWRSA